MPASAADTASSRYEDYYGLVEPPFTLTPNPRFLFFSHSHAAALDQIATAFRRRESIMIITGEIGTGKTLLCRAVLDRLDPRTFLSVVSDPLLGADDLLLQVAEDFGVLRGAAARAASATRHAVFGALQQFLGSLASLKAHAVIMIDEAQHLQPAVLEQLRLLSNCETAEAKLLQIILVGQPDLLPLLKRPDLRQFEQRVTRRCQLEPLAASEVEQYVTHRLAVASGDSARKDLQFTPEALRTIATVSRGIPRVVNIVSDRALEAGFVERRLTIDDRLVRRAAQGLDLIQEPAAELDAGPAAGRFTPPLVAAAAVLALLTAAGGYWFLAGRSSGEGQAVPNGGALAAGAEAAQETSRAPAGTGAAGAAPGRGPSGESPTGTASSGAPEDGRGASAPAGAPARPAPAGTPSDVPPSPAAPAAATETAVGPAAAGPVVTGEQFMVVVASFRTETRASQVAAEIKQLGLPASARSRAGGWQQVVVGPYGTREEAVRAQGRLTDAFITDTLIAAEPARP
jgi:general secretion pathway protein A